MPVQLHEDNGLPNAARTAAAGSEIERILDLARWAPSGDNTQPWRFEILGEDRIAVHVTREDNIYEYNKGQGTVISTGVLLETIRIAASQFGRAAEWSYLGSTGSTDRISIALSPRDSIKENPLWRYIESRSVDRRPYRTGRLSAEQKNTLKQAIGEEFEIQWYESLSERWHSARSNARATDIRLRLREAYHVHRRIIDWNRKFSPDGIPAEALGLDAMTLRLMRWVMGSWDRVNRMNQLPGATAVPQMELDLLPGVMCAAHFVVRHRSAPAPEDERAALIRSGQGLQRFWLTATQMGLSMQPALAPLCFATYAVCGGLPADSSPSIRRKAQALADSLRDSEGFDPGLTLFRGRIGIRSQHVPSARSIRRNAADLTA